MRKDKKRSLLVQSLKHAQSFCAAREALKSFVAAQTRATDRRASEEAASSAMAVEETQQIVAASDDVDETLLSLAATCPK